MMTFKEENNILFNKFLEDYFYKDFKNCVKELELIISPKCNLKCKYCYLNKYYGKVFPEDTFNEEHILENLDKIFNWIEENDFYIHLDLFSGDLLAQKIGYQILENILNFQKRTNRVPIVTIPTNYTFISSDYYTEKVQYLIDEFNKSNSKLLLSASFDGKYMDENRPYKHNLDIEFNHEYTDEYYDKIFKFNKKNNFGFHPMIYSLGIENWKKNFLWFQDMFKKHDITWNDMYLLQVRNMEWNDNQIEKFKEFIYFLCEWCFNKFDNDKNTFCKKLVTTNDLFNILSQPFSTIPRGVSCSIQTSLSVKLNDLTVYPCHRLMYPELKIGQFVNGEDNKLTFDTENASLGLTIYGCNTKHFPSCYDCPITELCCGGCLGAQYEVFDSMFIPINSVCKVNFALIETILKFVIDKNMYDLFITYIEKDSVRYQQITELKELL